jgi:hypothetical protein
MTLPKTKLGRVRYAVRHIKAQIEGEKPNQLATLSAMARLAGWCDGIDPKLGEEINQLSRACLTSEQMAMVAQHSQPEASA